VTRLFVAAWPPLPVAERLALLVDPVDEHVRRLPVDHLHVTLRFIGEADSSTVIERLRGLDLSSFTSSDVRLGPEIIRLGERHLVVPVVGADELAAAVRVATSGLGSPDRQSFFGHVTIARTRAATTIEGRAVGGSFALDDVRLVESRPEPSGSVYTTVARLSAT